jgi:alpha-L-fucosidase
MKKYIAFIVADVVLLVYTCYIRGSLTTQEKRMTDEERKEAEEILYRSVQIANKFGPLILDEADNSGGTAATSAAIMLSSFCDAMGMSLHDTMGLLMSVHKQTIAMEREE